LAILAALVAAPASFAAPATEVLRVQPETDGVSPLALWANDIYTWNEGTERVYALSGSVWIQQDRTTVWADRAIVWLDEEAIKKRKPVRVVVYADQFRGKAVGVETKEQPKQQVDTSVLEFTTPALGMVRGRERQQSVAESKAYRRALVACGKPVPELADAGKAIVGEDVEPAQFVRPSIEPGGEQPETIKGSAVLPVPISDTRTLWLSSRTTRPFNIHPIIGEQTQMVTGGIKLLVKFTTGAIRSIEVEADQVIIWQNGKKGAAGFGALTSPEGSTGADGIELYMTGNVVMRYGAAGDAGTVGGQPQMGRLQNRTLRADRVYYDVSNHRAIATSADMEYTREGFLNAGHIVADEMHQLSSTEFTAYEVTLHASRLPSDPGLRIRMDRADVYRQPRRERRTIFGTPFRDRLTGEVVEENPDILETENFRILVRDVPIFWLPSTRTLLNDPFGPFNGVTLRQDRIFGFQALATWDMLELIGITPLRNERWTLETDYMARRGPGVGTNYSLSSPRFLGMDAPYQTLVKGYFMEDAGTDILGGPRQNDYKPTNYRGRFLWRHQQEFTLFEPGDLTWQSQVAYLSDRNFLEQYYNLEHRYGPNQETFLWMKYQSGNTAGTFLFQPDLGRQGVSETHWLPRVDGHLIGESFFDALTYHTWASAGYARLDPFRSPASEYPDMVDNGLPPPEQPVDTARFDWMQRISAPFDAGPFRVTPYGVLDLAYYSQNVNGDQQGRLYGGGGVKTSIPFSRLYRDVESELFNVQGLYHKNQFNVNYFRAGSSASWAALPQLDRLNDDATESAWRNVTPWQPAFTHLDKNNGIALGYGSYNIFNPRLYAIRRLVDTNPDTLDDIHEVQMEWRQRLQTKRGYPGIEHTVDWLTFDTSATIFPTPDRDNFGSSVGFLEYRAVWNVGDMTSFFSNGWFDPFENGARYLEVGSYFFRDDRTSYTLAYRSIDPIQSRVVSAATTYVFSPKYAVTAVVAYDFGSQASLTNILQFTRVGTDMAITVGVTYNSLINNFGLNLSVVPNLVASQNTPVPGQRGMNQSQRGLGGSGTGGSGLR
jgi:hypothetical protein